VSFSFQTVFTLSPLPACLLDGQGKVVAWNRALGRLTGLDEQDCLGHALADLGPPAASLAQAWQKALNHKNEALLEVHQHFFRLTLLPIEGETTLGLLQPAQETTLGQKGSEVLALVAHELHNPLSAMRGYIDLVKNFGALNDKQAQFLRRLQVAVDDMEALVTSLSDMAWLDAQGDLHLRHVDLRSLAEDALITFRQKIDEKKIHVTSQLEKVPAILADERRLRQVVNNLVSNAIKYSRPGGKVHLQVQNTPAGVEFSVSDDGIGIPPEYHHRIFERFFRVPHQATQSIDGKGIGLALSYEVLARHAVELHLTSEVNQGSRFWFTFPPL
jgi:two-component system phosphate regulon sensor histidine kinase PhoR